MRHSQRMNDPPIPIWVILSQEGTIISAHCMGCKVGFGLYMSVRPLDEVEMNAQLKKLNELNVKPVILSLFKPYSESFMSRSQHVLIMPDLYDPSHLKLSYPDRLKQCFEVSLDLNDNELDAIEEDTRQQSKGNFFYIVAHSNPMQPSESLIKSLCYPHLFKVTSKAISHGKKYEKTAVETHKDFQVKYCGMIVDKEHPWLHAIPDFMASCSCCGDGFGRSYVLIVLRMGIFRPTSQRRPPVLKW